MDRRSFIVRFLAVGLAEAAGALAGAQSARAAGLNTGMRDGPMNSLRDEEVAIAMNPATASAYELTVFRSPTCGCCEKWTEHMQAAGFSITEHVSEDMDAIKQRYGVPAGLDSCHTALVDGYVIEGHVPAEDVQRLLSERPDTVGITAPGMPMGSPGMETDDDTPPYTIFSFAADGTTEVFAEH
jgi:hypothetical protein